MLSTSTPTLSRAPSPLSSSSSEREDDALVERLERRRVEQTDEEYKNYCAALCRTGRLQQHRRMRALVWRDVVLGRDRSAAVPQLTDGIIQQIQDDTHYTASLGGEHNSEDSARTRSSFSAFASPTRARGSVSDLSQEGDAQEATQHQSDALTSTLFVSSPAITNISAPVASHPVPLRRRRHTSLELYRTGSATTPSVDVMYTEGGEGVKDARTSGAVPKRRRAFSQPSQRVTCGSDQYIEFTKGTVACENFPTTTLSEGVLWPMAWYHLPDNCQPRVVEADIARSLWKLYPKAEERTEQRRTLKQTILRVLVHNPECFYYQGLHELMGFAMYVLLPHLETEAVVSVCEGLLKTRWKKFSARRLLNTEAMLYATHAVIAQEDPPLAAALEWCGVGPESHYAVSWIITWYVHSISNVKVLTRLFDYFVADVHGTAVLYFTAALIMSQRATIFEWISVAKEEMGPKVEIANADDDGIVLMARVYAQLSRMPSTVLESITSDALENLLAQAEQYQSLHNGVVMQEELNFLDGHVQKLGLLSNERTRNAALRLLWHFLPREWRSPAKVRSVQRFVFWATVMAAATAVFLGAGAAHVTSDGWMPNLLHR